jgi:hypothetical protein
MKILLITIAFFISTLLSLASGCVASTPATLVSSPAITLKPLPTPATVAPPADISSKSIPPEQMAVQDYLISENDIKGLGLTSTRQLSADEQESIKRIGMNTDIVTQAIKDGSSSRVERVLWMLYNSQSQRSKWSYLNYNEGETVSSSDFVYFPAVRIGLGSPQMFQVDTAVDLSGGKAVYTVRHYDKHVAAPSYLKPLTDEEKQKLLEIASASKTASQLGPAQETSFHWVAISASGGTLYNIADYDIFEKGISADIPLEAKSLTVYPAVTFVTGSTVADITIDLATGKIMDAFSSPKR